MHRKSVAITTQRVAEAASDNAAIAQRIKAKLLKRLEKEIDALPEYIGSESRQSTIDNEFEKNDKGKPIGSKPSKSKEVSKSYNLKALTAAYKDLTDDMNLNTSSEQVRVIIDV